MYKIYFCTYYDSQTHYRNQVAFVHKSTFSPSVGHKPTWGVRLIRLCNWPSLHPLICKKQPRCCSKKTTYLKPFSGIYLKFSTCAIEDSLE